MNSNVCVIYNTYIYPYIHAHTYLKNDNMNMCVNNYIYLTCILYTYLHRYSIEINKILGVDTRTIKSASLPLFHPLSYCLHKLFAI